MPLLEVEGLEKRIGRRKNPDGISFSLEQGDILAVLGPNGAGKTTLFAILAGLRRFTAGTVTFAGKRRLPRHSPDGGGIRCLPDASCFDGNLTGLQHVKIFHTLYGCPDLTPSLTLGETLALNPYLLRPVRDWSLGTQRKLGLLLALVGNPRLVLLDEPVNGLDAAAATGLCGIIREKAAQGTAFAVSGHRVAELGKICTHYLMLLNGKAVDFGSTTEIARPEVIVRTERPEQLQTLIRNWEPGAEVAIDEGQAAGLEYRYRQLLRAGEGEDASGAHSV